MRRKISVKILSLLMCMALIFSCLPLAFAEESKTFSIATINDTHYYPESLSGNKKEALYTYLEGHNCVYEDLYSILDAALASLEYEVKNNGVKYIALVGDLTTNGEYEGHIELAQKLKAFEEKTGAVILVTPGNHDINNSRASSFVNDKKEPARITTPAEFYEIYKDLGFSDAYHKFTDFTAGTHGSLSYSVKTDDGYRLILADAGKFTSEVTESGEDEQETGGTFTPELLSWVLSEAEDAKKDGETPILFTHWNLSGMNYFHEYLMQGFVIDDGYKLQEILADAGINYAFGGHQHVSDISITYSDSGNPMYSVITPTLSQFPFSYRVTDFTKTNEDLSVTFNQKSCDEYSGVKALSGNGTYPTPYRETGFFKQHSAGTNGSGYLFKIIKNALDGYINDIRAEGSIVSYIEKELDIDIEELVNTYLFGGITFEGVNVLSGANVMSFLDDLDTQLMEKFIYQKSNTYALIQEVLSAVVDTQISEIPCTKFIDTYGFGDPDRGGTLGDVFLSVVAYMYHGNEDISDDPFMQDFVEFCGTTEFFELLLDIVKEHIVDTLLFDTILGSIDFHLDSLFINEAEPAGGYVQMIYTFVLGLIDSGLFNAENAEDFAKAIAKIANNFNDISLKRLVEAVLGTGLLPFGTTTDELVDYLINEFLPPEVQQAAVYQAKIVLGGMLIDDTKDFDVTYVNKGAIDVVPTKEDMQIPVNTVLSPTSDNSTSFTISWFTKYSVTNTDIEIVKSSESFKGVATTGKNITAVTEDATYTAPGFDAGTIAILPWTQDVVKHTVTVTGLSPDTEYKFRFGDFEKGFTDEGSITTAPEKDGKFTFIHASGTEGFIPLHYENFSDVLNAADTLYPDYRFMVHTGSFVEIPENDDEWSYAFSAGENHFKNKLTAYAPGENDADGEYTAMKYFSVDNAEQEFKESGIYYSYNYGDAHFVILNTNLLTSGGLLSKEQTEWLKKDLNNSDKTWNILVMHQSIYGTNTVSELHKQIVRLMEEYDVDLILQGSESVYVRTGLIDNDTLIDAYTKKVNLNGTQYDTYYDAKGTVAVISGSAGHSFEGEAPYSNLYEESESYSLPMFSAITIDGNILAVDAYTVDGDKTEKVDSFAIEKSDSEIKLGDVNLDGEITAADARLALRYSVGLEALSKKQKAAANANLDDSVTSADARLILRASVGLEKIKPEYIYLSKTELNNIKY